MMPLEAQWQHQKGLCSMGSARDIFHDLACKELKALSGDMLKRTMSIYE